MKTINIKLYTLILCLFLLMPTIRAQESEVDISQLSRQEICKLTYEQLIELDFEKLLELAQKLGISVDELLNQSLSVASLKNQTPRETPGIVSVITSEQIQRSGARDLYEVLSKVPGIYFGYDVDGVIGVSMRGNWGHEGKVLFLIDDMELNEGMYSTTPLIKHISADQISRVEIIRGPGSALYGGSSELGVIKVVTKDGEAFSGGELNGNTSFYQQGLAGYSVSGGYGRSGEKVNYSLQAGYNEGNRAAGDYTDVLGDTYPMHKDYSKAKDQYVNFKIGSGGFNGNLLFDNYVANAYDCYDQITENRFQSLMGRVNYTFDIGEKITITPSVFYKNQLPYWVESPDYIYKRSYNQIDGRVLMKYDINDAFDLIGGIGIKNEIAKISDEEQESEYGEETFINDKDNLRMNTLYGFAQANYSGKIGNVFAGLRVENHNEFGSALAPRIGYTKVFDKFHFKALFNKAFRSPSIENYNLNEDIKLERTTVYELELGYKINRNIFITTNLYHIEIKDPIIYWWDVESEEENYENSSKTGSIGMEAEIVALYDKWDLRISYAWYQANNDNEIYKVILPEGEKKNYMQGMPPHMVHVQPSVKLMPSLILSASASYFSDRYGFVSNDENQEKLSSYTLFDCTLLAKDLLVNNLDVRFSVNNIFNQSYEYVQPYGSQYNVLGPYPGAAREMIISMKYNFGK